MDNYLMAGHLDGLRIIDMYLNDLETIRIPLEDLSPNPWNPNEMDEKRWEALGQSIEQYGIDLQPLVVRQRGDHYQIIDGEHRYRWAQELKIKQLPAIVVEVDDVNAKKMTQILNRTRGEDNPVKLKELLDSLLVEIEANELINGLPIETEAELNYLLADLEKQVTQEYDLPDEEEMGAEDEATNKKCPNCGFNL